MDQAAETRVARISVAYDGDAVRDGSMDVQELAPALIALGDLFKAANRTTNGEQAALSVRVQAEFGKGSFVIDLALHLNAVVGVIQHADLSTAAEVAKIVLGSGGLMGLLGLLKKLKGEKPEVVKEAGSDVHVEIREGSVVHQVVVNKNVYQVYLDPNARGATERVLAPLRSPGIDTFEVVEDKKPVEYIRRAELAYFKAPEPVEPPSEDVAESTYVAAYEIVKPSFESGLTWMLSDGTNHFGADVEDETFLKRLEAREVSFTKGDILKVEMNAKSTRSAKGLKTRLRILRVLDHQQAPRQRGLLPAADPNKEKE